MDLSRRSDSVRAERRGRSSDRRIGQHPIDGGKSDEQHDDALVKATGPHAELESERSDEATDQTADIGRQQHYFS